MSQFITIAGPQSSGKTTAINHLRKKYKDWYFVEVIDPYTVASKNHAGAVYTDRSLQINILEIELIKLKNLERENNPVFIVETGIFRLVYTQFFYHKKLADLYLQKYLHAYNELNSSIIYIDTTPEVSFARREERYVERIKRKGITDHKQFDHMLKKYRDTIYNLYPHWLHFYEKIRFPKIKIENSSLSEKQFLKEVDTTIRRLV